MIKLATYKIFKNTQTGKIKRIPLDEWQEGEGHEKVASAEWVEVQSEEEV